MPCTGQTPEQVVLILARLARHHANVIAMRVMGAVHEAAVAAGLPVAYYPEARLLVAAPEAVQGVSLVVVVSGGTADLPVAEEAAVTAISSFFNMGTARKDAPLRNLPLRRAARRCDAWSTFKSLQ